MKQIGSSHKRALTVLLACAAGFSALAVSSARADQGSGGGLASLKSTPPPRPANLAQFILNEQAAIRLGKALFWDVQAGGDGQQACASCHFNSGVDNRTRNTINPHDGGQQFDSVPGANADLLPSMFPIITNDVVGSAGVVKSIFSGLSTPGDAFFPADLATSDPDSVYTYAGVNIRQVTGRNAPSVINAAYNFRNFWDGRARETFNGVNPFGANDPNARVLSVDAVGAVTPVQISINNASLASQAVGPANNSVEMSRNGRSFPLLGRKLLNPAMVPLGQQLVDAHDSSLGSLSGQPANGLTTRYAALVQQAFRPQWVNSNQCVNADLTPATDAPGSGCPTSFTVMEANFSLYWGLAVQLYEATLIANDTPFDRFAQKVPNAMTAQQSNGLAVFTGQGKCTNCHSGPELTKASVNSVLGTVPFNPDVGFFNTGVRPISEDTGSVTIQNGNFKVPHLRNVELSGPYFHNGDKLTLRQVVDFYNRGGDFPSNQINSQIRPLGLSEQQKNDLVAFLLALTDARVKNESVPFDHPSLRINNGHNADGTDNVVMLPAVGSGGRTVASLPPLQPFLNVNHFQP